MHTANSFLCFFYFFLSLRHSWLLFMAVNEGELSLPFTTQITNLAVSSIALLTPILVANIGHQPHALNSYYFFSMAVQQQELSQRPWFPPQDIALCSLKA